MASHEFSIHHYVDTLLQIFELDNCEEVRPEVYIELLVKKRQPHIATQISVQNSKRKIAEKTDTPVEFLSKYDDLKARNSRDLDLLVYFLSKICDDDRVKTFLKRIADNKVKAKTEEAYQAHNVVVERLQHGAANLPIRLEEIKKALRMKEAAGTPMPSEAMRRLFPEKFGVPAKAEFQVPDMPEWFNLPYLSQDFLNEGPIAEEAPIGTLPLQDQEEAIMDDLLYTLEGITGKYIYPLPVSHPHEERQFTVDSTLDPTMRELVKKVLPTCADYSLTVRFIEEKSNFEHGLVNQALAAAMQNLMKDYYLIVAQLEHQLRIGQLTLQKFWYYIQPSMSTLHALASIASTINKGHCRGGSVLSLLHERVLNSVGDEKLHKLALYLVEATSLPYFDCLQKWIYKGIVVDPYCEFMVIERSKVHKENLQHEVSDSYWEQKYTLCRDRIPAFLQSLAEKILTTGKYLNVVRETGKNIHCPNATELVYSMNERVMTEQIERAHDYASKLLLGMLMDDHQLIARLRSLKHYFLLDQGDFIVQFMDMTEEEMQKPMNDVIPEKLDSLLELALRSSVANADPFKEDVRVHLLPYDLISMLNRVIAISARDDRECHRPDPTELSLSGLEAFSFDYEVKWPLSLLLNRKAIIRYQMLFRYLFYAKHVERQLCNIWMSTKSANQFSPFSTKWSTASFALRQRMLNFVQNLQYYMSFEVLEPNWIHLMAKIDKVKNIDELLVCHYDFLDTCLSDCMLTSRTLLKTVHKLMAVCVMFSNHMLRMSRSFEIARGRTTEMSFAEGHSLSEESFAAAITVHEESFSKCLGELLTTVMEESSQLNDPKLINLVHRLDANGFYSEQITMALERSLRDTTITVADAVDDSGTPRPESGSA